MVKKFGETIYNVSREGGDFLLFLGRFRALIASISTGPGAENPHVRFALLDLLKKAPAPVSGKKTNYGRKEGFGSYELLFYI